MALTGRQKAAMLLMSSDAAAVAELVKGLDAEVVRELALELAYLDAAGLGSSEQSAEIVRQFCSSLRVDESFHLGNFLNEMLKSTVGGERAAQIQIQIRSLLHKRDPFMSIRSADPQAMASVLDTEHPQAAAVVLSELPTTKSSEVIGLMDEGVRVSTIARMTGCEKVTVEAKVKIVQTVCKRLEVVGTSGAGEALAVRSEQSLRKIALILRSFGKELRDGLLGAIQKEDGKAGEMVAKLMIVWADIPQVADRSLQKALTGVGTRTLALALHRADEMIAEKIRSNISERAVATVDEEASLMLTPEKEDIEAAREGIVRGLREMNEEGELVFARGQYDV